MRTLLVFMAVFWCAFPARAQLWERYWQSAKGTSYYDTTSIQRQGSKVAVGSLINLQNPSRFGRTGDWYLSLLSTDEIDCEEKTWRIGVIEAWSGSDGQGKLVFRSEKVEKKKLEIKDAQNIGELYRILCIN